MKAKGSKPKPAKSKAKSTGKKSKELHKSKESNKFYITTAIDYPNAEPHIGHAYQKIIADVFARWNRLMGKDVWFLTGTDEHGRKIQEAAEKAGKKPKEFVDELAVKFKKSWELLDIKPSRFIRTTDKDHEQLVQEVIKKCFDNGDIYKGTYEGLYCVGCEAYYTEKECVDGKCPLHNRPLDKIKEESYFFRLSKYQDFLLKFYKDHPEFILPEQRRNEMTNRVKEGLKDLSISRTSFSWGIPFPLDKKHIVYVWFDALFNYLTGSSKNNSEKHEYWPAQLHLLGKDNGWFHTVYWPAFLKSAGYDMPKTVFIHGFLTFNGQKISKSLGNAISPDFMVEKYGSDSIRYFVCRNFVFGEDGDFSEAALVERHNTELANKLGNLISRVSTLAEKYGLQKTAQAKELDSSRIISAVKSHLEKYEIDKALNKIFSYIDRCNEFVQIKKPWETKDAKTLYQVANAIKDFTILLSPFIPRKVDKIASVFHFDISMKSLDKDITIKPVKKSEILFSRIDNKPQQAQAQKQSKSAAAASVSSFSRVQLKVAKILDAQPHPNADKLFVLQLDLGKDKRQLVAGLRKYYSASELVGKTIIVITNFKYAKLRGIESQGMLLAADDGVNVGLLTCKESPGTDVFAEGITYDGKTKDLDIKEFLDFKLAAKGGKAYYADKVIRTKSGPVSIEKVKDGNIR